MAQAKNKIIILIGGNAGSGKDSLAEFLVETLSRWAGVRTDAYAWALKRCVHLKTGIPMEVFMDTKDVKESYIDPLTGKTVRTLLQNEGETARNEYGYLVWANGTRARAEFAQERITIVTDARHPKEEIHWMKEECSKFARVFAIRIRRSSVAIKRGHPSEDLIADEPDASFDFLVENEGDLNDLRVQAEELANAIIWLVKTGRKKIKRAGDGWHVGAAYEPLDRDEADLLSVDDEPEALTYHHLAGTACS